MEEIWKDIPSFEGYYQASNLGRIRSLDRVRRYNKEGFGIQKGTVLKPYRSKKYYRISLYLKGKGHRFFIHRLVFMAFNPAAKIDQINHINGNGMDNRIENLELSNPSHNMIHAYENGLISPSKGKAHSKAIINDLTVLKVFGLKKNGLSQSDISTMLNISRDHVKMILLRKCWKHINIPKHLIYKPDANRLIRRPLSENTINKIIKLIVKGLTNTEIAKKINLPRQTINGVRRRNLLKTT